ncbi:glucosyltransferase domain-containing protein [Acetobacter sp. LMG 32666]|uniref:glucosyltransferase domain-containing protein n=1 Tax=Acetobacter sp. LMG 32666 TaxID=2959295 RepID=UPI0030C818D9
MTKIHNHIANYKIIYFAYLLFFAIIYHSVLTSTYGFTDDYTYIEGAHKNMASLMQMMVSGGRPVYALFSYIYIYVTDAADLCWVRFISIAGISALCTLFFRHLREQTQFPLAVCIITAACVGLLPAFQLYAAWSVTAFYPWAAFLAGMSFRALQRPSRDLWKNFIGSLTLLSIAMCIYQPAAMMYWVFVGMTWVASGSPLPRIKNIVTTSSVMAGALVVDFVATKTLPLLLFPHTPSLARIGLVSHIGKKTTWFLLHVMPNALALPYAKGSIILSIFVLIFILAGFFIDIKQSQNSPYWKILICLGLLPLTYLPNLLVQENWPTYRTQPALSSLLLLYFVVAALALSDVQKHKKMTTTLMSLVLLGCIWFAYSDVKNEITRPQSAELQLVSTYLAGINDLKDTSVLYLVPSSKEKSLAPFVRYDEFGRPSTSETWSLTSMLWVILNARHAPNIEKLATAHVGALSDAPQNPDMTIIDFNNILEKGHISK